MAIEDNLKDEELAGGFNPKNDDETFLAEKQFQYSKNIKSSSPQQKSKSIYLLIIPLVLLILSGLLATAYFVFFSEKDTDKKITNNDNTKQTLEIIKKNQIVDSSDRKETKYQTNKTNDKFYPYNTNNDIFIADIYSIKEESFKNENFFYKEQSRTKRKSYPYHKKPKEQSQTDNLHKHQEKKTKTQFPKLTEKQKPVITKPPQITPKFEKKQDSIKTITKKEEPKIQKPISTEKSDMTIPIPETGIYAIQLLATPSKEEAEIFLNKLKNKNISNVYITTQKKRDIIWYRVRVGNYKSFNEAQEAAKSNGWTQSWIDRVR